jgi:hypothetical protein
MRRGEAKSLEALEMGVVAAAAAVEVAGAGGDGETPRVYKLGVGHTVNFILTPLDT